MGSTLSVDKGPREVRKYYDPSNVEFDFTKIPPHDIVASDRARRYIATEGTLY